MAISGTLATKPFRQALLTLDGARATAGMLGDKDGLHGDSCGITRPTLETDGFLVESSAGDLGWIEEVWVDEAGDADAVAVRTADGRHGLLLDEDVLAVDRESRWVVVSPETRFLELDTPHVTGRPENATARLESSWATTGDVLEVAPRPRHLWHVPYRPEEPARSTRRRGVERPLWQGIAALLLLIAVLVGVTVTLTYVIAGLVAGAAP